jgi:hypothetical protein
MLELRPEGSEKVQYVAVLEIANLTKVSSSYNDLVRMILKFSRFSKKPIISPVQQERNYCYRKEVR